MPEDKKHKFNEDVENVLTKFIVSSEFETARRAKGSEIAEFESIVQMLECVRAEKDYEWLSDYFIPELPSKILTDMSNMVAQYFQTRDFVEVRLEGNKPGDEDKCRAAKQCINQTLNNNNIHHYQKYVRGRMINSLGGEVVAVCWWEQKTKPIKVGEQIGYKNLDIDIQGNPITSGEQIPQREEVRTDIIEDDIIVDQFNYDVLPPQRVFMDRTYTYSIQEKSWVILWFENTYEDLKKTEEECDYFNLDFVKELFKNQGKTDLSKETYTKDQEDTEPQKPMVKKVDRLMRFGKVWAIIKDKDSDGFPTKIVPGLKSDGEPEEGVEVVDAIIEVVFSGSNNILIRFQPNPNRTSKGKSYYPLVRGLCYIHPTKDTGLSDGKYLRELQIGENDMFNLGSDRVKLATLPTLKVRRNVADDNSSLYIEPQHAIECDDPMTDITELQIRDNINGTIAIEQMMFSAGDKVTSIFPTTMGELPGKASTSATAVAGAEMRSNTRANYKSLTYEYTFLTDFYWLILQMIWQFAHKKTAIKMMGEDAQFFDPEATYTYSPVSGAIETEYNRYKKLQMIDQFIGRLVNAQNPNTVKMINYLMSMAFELFGKEFPQYKDYLLQEGGGVQPGANQPTDMKQIPMSNQMGQPMSIMEEGTREGWNSPKSPMMR